MTWLCEQAHTHRHKIYIYYSFPSCRFKGRSRLAFVIYNTAQLWQHRADICLYALYVHTTFHICIKPHSQVPYLESLHLYDQVYLSLHCMCMSELESFSNNTVKLKLCVVWFSLSLLSTEKYKLQKVFSHREIISLSLNKCNVTIQRHICKTQSQFFFFFMEQCVSVWIGATAL